MSWRFRKHNRFLRSLKDDTLLIIDNFNVTATQDSFLSVMLKYRCRILFTTRSKFDGHCILQLKEIQEPSSLFQLASLENEDKISAIKDGQSSKVTYYNHIHTLFSLYSISQEQQDIMRDLCFLPPAGVSARIFADWLGLTTLNKHNFTADIIARHYLLPGLSPKNGTKSLSIQQMILQPLLKKNPIPFSV